MGVALFVLAACVALWWWRESQRTGAGPRWLALAAFFLGLAAGSKYQALTFLPLVALFVIRRERRPGVWAVALLCFLLPCIYWYARNAVMTGDPFNPIGARLFGFTNWNLADYKQQLDDVRAHAALPSLLIWPVVLAPFSQAWRRSPAVHAAIVFCAYSLVVWALTSRYPRYLTASFPLLALIAVLGWQVLLGWHRARACAGCCRNSTASAGPPARALVRRAVAGRAGGRRRPADPARARDGRRHAAEREAFLRANVPGYAVMRLPARARHRPRLPDRAERGDLLRAQSDLGRRARPVALLDFIVLPPAEIARELAGLGFEAIAVAAPSRQCWRRSRASSIISP